MSCELLQVDNAALQSDGDSVRSIIRAKLGENAPDVTLDGFFSEGKLRTNRFVRVSLRHEVQDIHLAWRQRIVSRVLRDLSGNLRGYAFVARVDRANGLQQLLAQEALQ